MIINLLFGSVLDTLFRLAHEAADRRLRRPLPPVAARVYIFLTHLYYRKVFKLLRHRNELHNM